MFLLICSICETQILSFMNTDYRRGVKDY